MMTSTKTSETILERFQYQKHTIERYTRDGENRVRIIEPDGTVFDNMVFGPTCPDTLPDMLAWHRKGKPKEAPHVTDRELILALTKRVEALEAMRLDVGIPTFLQDAPPHEVADLIDWTAPPKERQQHLIAKLREINGLIGLAEDRGGRAAPELYTRRDRIESGIRYNRATSVEEL